METHVALRTVIVMFMVGGMAVWGQAPQNAPAGTGKADKVDKATAYYHFMLACVSAEGGNSGDAAKVNENIKAAREADPKAPNVLPRRPFPVIPYRQGPTFIPPPAPQQR